MSAWDIDLDLDEVDETAPQPPAEGIYKAEIVQAEPGESSSGKPMIRLQSELNADVNGEALEDARKLYDNLVITEAAAFRTKQLLLACGFEAPLPKIKSEEDAEALCEELVGCEYFVKVEHEIYKGRTQARAREYYAEPPSEDEDDGANRGSRRRRRKAKEEPAGKAKKKTRRKTRAKKEEPEDEPEETEDPEEAESESEGEDEAPKGRVRRPRSRRGK